MLKVQLRSEGQAFQSKILKKKWQAHEFELHKQKIQTVKAQTDTTRPNSLKFPLLKSKKRQLQEDKLTEIERANRILLEKMTLIMNSEESFSVPRATRVNQTISGINNTSRESSENDRKLDNSVSKRSLNQRFRKRHLSKINQENTLILDRLRQQKSHYDSSKWQQANRKREEILRLRTEYPDQLDARKSQKKLSTVKSRQSVFQKALQFRNQHYILPNQLNQNPSYMEFHSRKEVITSGGELITQPPVDIVTDDEMEELIKEVRSAEKGDRGKKAKDQEFMGQQDDTAFGSIDDNVRNLNSDLQNPNFGQQRMQQQKSIPKLHQTVSYFHSKQQSNDYTQENGQQRASNMNLSNQYQVQESQHHPQASLQLQTQYQSYMVRQDSVEQANAMHVQTIRPLYLKYHQDIDPERIVLYREDFREILPHEINTKKVYKPKFYIVEVSRSRYKLYLIAVKIPEKYLDQVIQGKLVYHLAQSPKCKAFYTEMTEKQGKKLLAECENNYKQILDRVFVQFGRLHIRDFENLMKFGSTILQNTQFGFNSLQQSSSRVLNNSIYPGQVNQHQHLQSQSGHQNLPFSSIQQTKHAHRFNQDNEYQESSGGQKFISNHKNYQMSPQQPVSKNQELPSYVPTARRYQNASITSKGRKSMNDESYPRDNQLLMSINSTSQQNNVSKKQLQQQQPRTRKSQHFPSISQYKKENSLNNSAQGVPGNWDIIKSPFAQHYENDNEAKGQGMDHKQTSRNNENSKNNGGAEKNQEINQFIETYIDYGKQKKRF